MNCDDNGECSCKEKYTGVKCDECIDGHYLVSSFDGDYCEGNLCNMKLNRNVVQYFFSFFVECQCYSAGSSNQQCDSNGECPCVYPYAGPMCNICESGAFMKDGLCNCKYRGSSIIVNSITIILAIPGLKKYSIYCSNPLVIPLLSG